MHLHLSAENYLHHKETVHWAYKTIINTNKTKLFLFQAYIRAFSLPNLDLLPYIDCILSLVSSCLTHLEQTGKCCVPCAIIYMWLVDLYSF